MNNGGAFGLYEVLEQLKAQVDYLLIWCDVELNESSTGQELLVEEVNLAK
jgi:hypothetical protein